MTLKVNPLSSLSWSIPIAGFIFLILLCLEVEFLTHQPWIGLELTKIEDHLDNTSRSKAVGLKVTAIQREDLNSHAIKGDVVLAMKSNSYNYVSLTTRSLAEDLNQYANFKGFNQVLTENKKLYKRLTENQVVLKMQSGKEISFKPQQVKRPFSSLPLNFWIINATALIGLFFAIFMLTYRSQRTEIYLLSIIGFCFAVGSTSIAVHSSRSLVLSPDWYYGLLMTANLMQIMVAYSLLALVLIYPYRLASNKIVTLFIFIAIVGWLNVTFQWFDLPFNTFYFAMVVAFISQIPLFITQWFYSRKAPIERAALMWMIFPINIAIGSELLLFIIPSSFGEETTLPIWLSQVIFLPLYLGFIFAIFKYRLFDMERWWLISWHWILNGCLFISIEIILLSLFHLHSSLALGITIILMAWIYFPLRQWLWEILEKTPADHLENHIYELIQTFIGKQSSHNFKQHWQKLLQHIFSSSSATIVEGRVDKAKIYSHGMRLVVPGINDHCYIELYGRNNSSKLFNQQDIVLANTLSELAKHTKTQREAQQKGALLERSRIMRDLHDDVGANLLSMIYRANTDEDLQLAQSTLKMLRETIYTLDDKVSMRLSTAIAKWYQEMHQRCESAKVKLIWQVHDPLPKQDLSARQHINLGRVLREILSNALKHAAPSSFSVEFCFQNENLRIQIIHNGEITPLNTWREGKGIPSIKKRIQELHGTTNWELKKQLKFIILIPL